MTSSNHWVPVAENDSSDLPMAFLHELVKDCLQHEQAFCTVKCPFNLDVRDFVGKLQQGRFNAAYKTYQYATGFPGIVTALCPEPCREVCIMKDYGGSVSLKLLEKAAIDLARSKKPDLYNLPPKPQRVAVIGGGISGLACTLRLASKKYDVTVFEKKSRIGGHLHELLPEELFMEDIRWQFSHENYSLRLETNITHLADLSYDAFYVATGREGDRFGTTGSEAGPFATSAYSVFMGGNLTGGDTMKAIRDGLSAARVIEDFLKTGNMVHDNPADVTTRLTYNAIRARYSPVTEPADGNSYTREESAAEAARCLKCTCDACLHYSPLMGYFDKYPRRITEEVEVTIHPSSLDGEATLATRLIAACNHCGLCREVCPMDIDTGGFLLQSHFAMQEKGKMPWAFHEYYLRDMEFANGEAALARMAPDTSRADYMFFPGCQSGASDPELVRESYAFLRAAFHDTAIMLGCCGAPALWAGEKELLQKTLEGILTQWDSFGRPKVIFACPACKQMFTHYLPQIEAVFLYNLMDERGLAKKQNKTTRERASLFDPCASREEPELQMAVRRLAEDAGYRLTPLDMEGKMTECCSYGGQVAVAHPPLAEYSVNKLISKNELPYITYCTNCRDIFAKAGKKTKHILDILFERDEQPQPTVSERRKNRVQLREKLLNEIWNEYRPMKKREPVLIMTEELKSKLNENLILETDILEVISKCEESGNKLYDPEKESFTGYGMVGNMTFWAEYRVKGEVAYELLNAYSHRMKIEE